MIGLVSQISTAGDLASIARDQAVLPDRRRRSARGFTLVEVLATLMLMAIVLPAIMQGITLATAAAGTAQRRTEASGLAEEKLNELLATGAWQAGGTLSGDFSPDWPDYHWQAVIQNWALDTSSQSVQEIDLTVSWTARGRENSVSLSTLAYVKEQASG